MLPIPGSMALIERAPHLLDLGQTLDVLHCSQRRFREPEFPVP